ncbi:hypothetical protein [Ramlibacter sp.]|uniref:hypothetical protein n=1 Tax=Ramlibacter sp. TaxID=1917967 RepID=UPI0026337C2E|nr:hypothetical protein [Ramlibacter sp.]
MGWLQKIFGGTHRQAAHAGAPPTSQFHESEPTGDDDRVSRNAPRRELVQVILRDTMRQHGIPSDWIECRILSTGGRGGRPGMHVNFVVKQAHERLLNYVFAFQQSFERELSRFEPRSREWMLGLSWEFQDYKAGPHGMPEPGSWVRASAQQRSLVAAGLPGPEEADLERGFAPTTDPLGNEAMKSEDDVQRDLEALFAIRDAAMADTARKAPAHHKDFENTRPFEDSGGGRD